MGAEIPWPWLAESWTGAETCCILKLVSAYPLTLLTLILNSLLRNLVLHAFNGSIPRAQNEGTVAKPHGIRLLMSLFFVQGSWGGAAL